MGGALKFLLDTNVILEVALGQEKAAEAGRLLQSGREGLFISDLSLYSVGIHLYRRRKPEIYSQLMNDVFIPGAVQITSLPIEAHTLISSAVQSHGLDFEDAYQYCVATHLALSLISFDADFDRTPLKRLTPDNAMASPQ
jgi:predicted nucleic acid-binding protein